MQLIWIFSLHSYFKFNDLDNSVWHNTGSGTEHRYQEMITTDLHGPFGGYTIQGLIGTKFRGYHHLISQESTKKTQGTFYLSLFLKKIYNHRGVGGGTVAHVIEKVVGGNVHFSSCPWQELIRHKFIKLRTDIINSSLKQCPNNITIITTWIS